MKNIFYTTSISLLSLFFFTGCAVTSSTDQPDLTPLPTTGISTITTPSTIPYITNQEYSEIMQNLKDKDYINEVENWYGNQYIPMTTQTLIDFGHLWCEALQAGMTPFDVQSRIDEGSNDQSEANLHEAIVKAAVFHYCPEQQYKWESSN